MKPTILIERGPFAIVSARDDEGRDRPGLYYILVKDHQAKIGPYFADLSKATAALRKIDQQFPREAWKQPLSWLTRQKEMIGWIEKAIGYQEDLIGGNWVDDDGKVILSARRR